MSEALSRAEYLRLEAHKLALESLHLLSLPLAPPDPVIVVDAKRAQLDDIYQRNWDEFSEQADIAYLKAMGALQVARAVSP